MTSPSDPPPNVFLTCSVHLFKWPYEMLKGDPPVLHRQEEAIAKMDRFCHQIYQVPITWLCTYSALQQYGDTLAQFHRDYGDEVAIMEGGILAQSVLGGEVEKYQGWVEECGLARSEAFVSKEPEARGARCFHDMPYKEQKTALAYLKGYYDRVVGQDTQTLACPHTNQDTVRAMAEVGLRVSWGYCWNYFCEGINHKGCLFYPFYISDKNHNVPEQDVRKNRVLAVQWGPFSPVIGYSVEVHCRMGMPGYCLNALELTNRSEGHDKFRFHEKVIAEWVGQGRWNRYVHLPLQLEAVWIDEGEDLPGLYDQFPTFNPANTEVFYTEIETALRLGARPMTLSGFARWHGENVQDTAEVVYYSEDPLPELRSKGKDQPYQPMVLYGCKSHQYWFLKSRGFNYVRKYRYDPPVEEKDVVDEYPFENEPKVYLEIKRSASMRAGIVLTPERASYELAEFDLTAYHDDPDYAALLWEANIPPYVRDADLEIGGAVTGFRTVREKNLAILWADLKKGLNRMVFRSDLPNEHLRIKSTAKVGSRYEVWIQNDCEEVCLHTLRANLEPGLRIGGFWWDGFYSRTIFRYGWGVYDRETGWFELRVMYPVTLKMNQGLTRVSVELV